MNRDVPGTWRPYGACATSLAGAQCRCATSAECGLITGNAACVPFTQADVVAANFHVCAPNDAGPWHGCNSGSGCCASGYDCWHESNGNQYCGRSCSGNAACGNAGIACCRTVNSCANCFTTCGGSGGCDTCS